MLAKGAGRYASAHQQQASLELSARQPAATGGRIHDLHATSQRGPQHDEVRRSVSSHRNGDRRERVSLRQEHVIRWDQHLLRVETQALRDVLQCID